MSTAIEAETPTGTRVVLAYQHPEQAIATCAHPGCACPIQRTSSGDLRAGVRAHYKTVHPERKIR